VRAPARNFEGAPSTSLLGKTNPHFRPQVIPGPPGSQLLSRLGHEWDSSVQTGTDWVLPGPLTVTSRNGSGRSKQCPTALEALGARVPAEAPRADVVAVAPWEVPNWGERCQLIGVTHPKQRKEWVKELYSTITAPTGAIICVVSTVSNKGRPDN
jgi:hypothetical protein